jgi:hypothetical protein
MIEGLRKKTEAQFIVLDWGWGDKIDYGIGLPTLYPSKELRIWLLISGILFSSYL